MVSSANLNGRGTTLGPPDVGLYVRFGRPLRMSFYGCGDTPGLTKDLRIGFAVASASFYGAEVSSQPRHRLLRSLRPSFTDAETTPGTSGSAHNLRIGFCGRFGQLLRCGDKLTTSGSAFIFASAKPYGCGDNNWHLRIGLYGRTSHRLLRRFG